MMETGCLLTTVLLLENRIISISTLWDIAPIAVIRKSSRRVLDMYLHNGKYLVRFNMPFLRITPSGDKYENFKKAVQKAVNRL